MFDSPEPNEEDFGAAQVFNLDEPSLAECDAAWRYFSRHILPNRLLQIATGMATANKSEQQHLDFCDNCQNAYSIYNSEISDPHTDLHLLNDLVDDACCSYEQTELWPNDETLTRCQCKSHQSRRLREDASEVPTLVREHLQIQGPVVFGGEEVAFDSWQFGRLITSRDDDAVALQLVDLIVECATKKIRSITLTKKLLLVCFGRAMHRCGTRIAVCVAEEGGFSPHVILAHDYYSPTVICDNKEFIDADVLVIVDVVHSGTTLDGLMALCVSRGAHRVRGLAIIDQSEGKTLCAEWFALWKETREDRISLNAFVNRSSESDLQRLKRFEPNEEIAQYPTIGLRKSDPIIINRLCVDNELTKHIHETGALKQDHLIGQMRYPYVVNVLDLIKKSNSARNFILQRAASVLSGLDGKHIAFAYHAGRKSRAGKIAELLQSEFKWPALPIGNAGATFSVSYQQLKQLASFDMVIVVDAAIRTGDTLSAIVRAIDDNLLLKHTKFVSLSVLNGLSDYKKKELSAALGVEIKSLFDLPLPPPTEEVRHWVNIQKAFIRSRLASSGAFAAFEDVLSSYCAPAKGRSQTKHQSIDWTREQIENAVLASQSTNCGMHSIEAACVGGKPQFIRHLPVNEVVHDRNVQEMLIGVMYNSVKPSLKESAAFALASARNYDWMTLDWLKLNRSFITTAGHAWKSIVLVECDMKLSGRTRELDHFCEATLKFKEEEISRNKKLKHPSRQQLIQEFLNDEVVSQEQKPQVDSRISNSRVLLERLDTFAAASQ